MTSDAQRVYRHAMSLLLLFACAKDTEPPPRTFEELCVDLLNEFQRDDAAAEESAAELVDWLEASLDEAPDGYPMGYGTFDPDEVAHLSWEGDIDWDRVAGAIALTTVEGTVDDYLASVPEEDQSWADRTYLRWDRTILEGDADGFLDGASLSTYNDIEKSGPLGIVIPYPMQKDYTWYAGVPVFRSVVLEEGWGEGGENGIVGGFTIELWYDRPDGGVAWVNASWTHMVTIVDDIASEAGMLQELINGTHDYFEGTEAHVNGDVTAD